MAPEHEPPGKHKELTVVRAQETANGTPEAAESYDLVIVGTGVAGGLIAARLAAAGARVVMLEAGPRVNRDEAVNLYRATIAKTPESPYPGTDWAPRPEVLDLDGYFVQAGPETFKSTYERRVGGTTWHWLGTAVRLLPSDFAMQTRYGVGVDWPITYDELEPWYLEAEKELGVAGDEDRDLGSPRSGPYPMPPIPISFGDQLWAKAAATLGWAVEPTPQARNSVEYQGRPVCCGNAMCIPICPIQAKYDASYHVQVAEDAGARLIENAVAHRVEVDTEGKVASIAYKTPDGTDHAVAGRVYVLAANAIETAKLLLLSTSEATPNGAANSSDQVGRHLSDHPTMLSIAASVEPYYPYRGPLSVAGIEQLRTGDERRERSAMRIEIGNDGWSWPGFDPLGVAQQLIEEGRVGADLFRAIGERVPHQVRLASLTEQLPNPDNRVVPDEANRDALGIPRPKLTYAYDDYTVKGIAAAREAHDKLFDALGVTYRLHVEGIQGAGHLMGTHRMGADPTTSVTDADGRTHDHPNLFLAGAGLFPTTGTGNPTLTLAALALRTSATIAADLGVAAATPVASPTS
ncbi:MAG: glucose-methanol-choline oxidoreductase [Thermomicrobiales bacterium]|jgi:choline dehydrogenase-like flavoprotein|nr:glucose-methanol-choline oxidoreductase [Thermomicrobiales bacterium]